MDVGHLLSRDGVVATFELHRAGYTKQDIALLVRSGALIRVRQGWYSSPELAEHFQRAVRVGGRVGCVTGAEVHGLTVRNSASMHVCVPHNSARLRQPDDAKRRLGDGAPSGLVVHWDDQRLDGSRLLQSVPECLAGMALCQPVERTIAAADSALRLHRITRANWDALREYLPSRLSLLLGEADPRAESITESVARFRMHRLGYSPLLQVALPGVGSVDMMLDDLVLEFDGWAYHGDRKQFEKDRRRDAAIAALGLRSLRFSYRQVFERWHEVRAAIAGATRHTLVPK